MAQKDGIKIYGTLVSAMKDHKLAHADEIVADVTGVEGTNVRDILEELASKVSQSNSGDNTGNNTSGNTSGSTTTSDGHRIYLDEIKKRVVIVLPGKVSTKALYSPSSTAANTYVVITLNKRYYDFLVNGNDLENSVTVTASGGFKIKRVTDEEEGASLNLAKEEINPGEGVAIRVSPGSNIPGRTGVITVKSDGDEFETRYINVQYSQTMNDNTGPGSYTPGSGIDPIVPDSGLTLDD